MIEKVSIKSKITQKRSALSPFPKRNLFRSVIKRKVALFSQFGPSIDTE